MFGCGLNQGFFFSKKLKMLQNTQSVYLKPEVKMLRLWALVIDIFSDILES